MKIRINALIIVAIVGAVLITSCIASGGAKRPTYATKLTPEIIASYNEANSLFSAGKFDAAKISKSLTASGIADKISHRKLIIPGDVAILKGELEDELRDWKIMVGPRDAADIGGYLKQHWK